nr:transglycosylase SLT domain-containing protein [uncultured Holophaga sp.]
MAFEAFRTFRCLSLLLPLLAGFGLQARHSRRHLPSAPPLPARKPIPAGEARWLLTGGKLSGGHVSAAQRSQWPLWMQALCGGRSGVPARALVEADLDKVPDVFLVPAVDRLREAGVFTDRLLAQATEIGYTAEAGRWARARTAYQKAWLAKRALPVEDGRTCSRMLSQLTMEGEAPLVRQLLQASGFPGDSWLQASFLRRLELREAPQGGDPQLLKDARLPGEERFLLWRSFRGDDAGRVALLPDLKGTSGFGEAVLLSVQRGWLPLSDPLVDEAVEHPSGPKEQGPWFLVNLGERASDLLWLRVSEALKAGQWERAWTLASQLQSRFPDSWYAWHAAYLMKQGAPSRLKIAGDITFCNAEYFAPRMATDPGAWPVALRALAAKGRFDLILARVDPRSDSATYLRAAHMLGQQDLVVRHFAIHQDLSLATLPYLYPKAPGAYLESLIREEGAEGIVDPAFLLAAMKNESQFQPGATSGADARGLVQLLPATFRAMMGRRADIRDPETNIRAAIRYYKRIALVADLGGEPEEVRYAYLVAGYHAGEGRAKRWHALSRELLGSRVGPVDMLLRAEWIGITSTRQYVLRVLGDRRLFQQVLK